MEKKELTPTTAKSARNNFILTRHQTIVIMAKMLRDKFPELTMFESIDYATEILELVEKELYDGR